MSTRGRWIFAAAAVAVAFAMSMATLLAVDVYLHGRYERSAGFNVWGYRGDAVGKRQPGEYRVVVLGGSAAYGYGVNADEAIPAVLERLLRARTLSAHFTVVNLAYNNEGAYSFKTTLQDYGWLDYDLAFLYEGYNDLSERSNVQTFRHDSPVFRMTGYMPIFPIIFKEKASAMLNGGDTGAMYRQGENKTVFHSSLSTRAGAEALDVTANVERSLEAQLGRMSAEPIHHVDHRISSGCSDPWGSYCQSVASAVDFARANGKQVIVGTQPYLTVSASVHSAHVTQQTELREMLSQRFSADPDVHYVDFGNLLNLEDPGVSFDHMHLTASGNEKIAAALVEPVIEMAARRRQKVS